MLRRNIVALIGLLAVVNGSKWLFDGKRLPTLALGQHLSLNDIDLFLFANPFAVVMNAYKNK